MSEVCDQLDEDVVLNGPLNDYLHTCEDDGFSTSLIDPLPSTSKDAHSTSSLNDYRRSCHIDINTLFKSAKLVSPLRLEYASSMIKTDF